MISPDAILSCTSLTCDARSAGTSGETSPSPTPPEATSKTVFSPPEKEPSPTDWIVWNTATSTF